jgi:hypothetical protein
MIRSSNAKSLSRRCADLPQDVADVRERFLRRRNPPDG